ncbi:MAG TPA: hypothetical protein VG821_11050 [Rhizomicrobium sp.]|jgi:hypothetical protein|nr:hypothetical protein [Rhizomicrobium sp.]
MNALTPILAIALLATAASVAHAGDPIDGIYQNICPDPKIPCSGPVMKRGTNDFRGNDKSINSGDGHKRHPISDIGATGVLTKQKH